jgi:hypothetical protein
MLKEVLSKLPTSWRRSIGKNPLTPIAAALVVITVFSFATPERPAAVSSSSFPNAVRVKGGPEMKWGAFAKVQPCHVAWVRALAETDLFIDARGCQTTQPQRHLGQQRQERLTAGIPAALQ